MRIVICIALLVAAASGMQLYAGGGDVSNRISLVLLCWSAISIPTILAFKRLFDELIDTVGKYE